MKNASHLEILSSKDNEESLGFLNAESELITLLRILNKTTELKTLRGLDILDLASGSGNSACYWEPYFARVASKHGANVIAIDCFEQTKKDSTLFKWAKADLVKTITNNQFLLLPIIKKKKFDIIHSADFVGHNPVPGLHSQLSNFSTYRLKFEEMIIQQSLTLLKEGGIVFIGQLDHNWKLIVYRKINDKLVKEKH